MVKLAFEGGQPSGTTLAASKRKTSPARRALFVLVCLCLLPLAASRRAAAQSVPEVVQTGYEVTCGANTYSLSIVSASVTLKDAGGTQASSLGLVLIPRGKAGGPKIFNVYSFVAAGAAVKKRDDDAGAFALKEYDRGQIESNLNNFFKTAAGCPQERLPAAVLSTMAGVLNQNQSPPSASTFAQLVANTGQVSFPSTAPSAQTLPLLAAPASEEEFGRAVRLYSSKLTPPGRQGQEGGDDQQEEVNKLRLSVLEWKTKAANADAVAGTEKKRADALQAQLGAQGGGGFLSKYLWWILGAATLLVTAFFIFRKRVPLLSKSGAASTPDDSSRAGQELIAIRKKSRDIFERLPKGHFERCWEEIDGLLRDLRKFQRQYGPKGETRDALNRLINDTKKDLKSSRSMPKQFRPSDVYERLSQSLIEYQEQFYPLTAAAGAGAQGEPKQEEATAAGAVETKENVPTMKETSTIQGGSDGRSAAEGSHAGTPAQTVTLPDTQPAPPAPAEPSVVVLNEESLKAIEERVAAQIRSLPDLLNGSRERVRQMWELWAQPDETFGPDSLGTLVERNREVAAFVNTVLARFRYDGLGLQNSGRNIDNFFARLSRLRNQYLVGTDGAAAGTPDEIVDKLGEKLAESEGWRGDYRSTEVEMGNLRGDDNVFKAARRLAREHKTILNLLHKYRTGEGVISAQQVVAALYASANQLGNELSRIGEVARRGLKEAGGAEPEEADRPARAVELLVEKLAETRDLAGKAVELKDERDKFEERTLRAEPEAEGGKTLAARISDYLNFDPGRAEEGDSPVNLILGKLESESPFYRQLRLRFSAALLALYEALAGNAREDVLKALNVEGAKGHLKELALSLQGINPDELWERGFSSGFHGRWLHELFRANLLLNYYFEDVGELYTLRDAVAQACWVLDSAMRRRGLQFARVGLLKEPPPDTETIKNALPAFIDLPEVKQKVTEKYRSVQSGGFVVDVQAFSLMVNGVEKGVPRVFIMNPSDWD